MRDLHQSHGGFKCGNECVVARTDGTLPEVATEEITSDINWNSSGPQLGVIQVKTTPSRAFLLFHPTD